MNYLGNLLERINTDPKSVSICVIGLGYVGLPLAVAFKKAGFRVYGHDTSCERLQKLERLECPLGIHSEEDLEGLGLIEQSYNIAGKDIYIVSVPTDVDAANQPDLAPLRSAAGVLQRMPLKPCVVISESTVYPGATREVFKFDRIGVWLGYSPERIVPGKPQGNLHGEGHTLENTVKLVAGEDEPTLDVVAALYGKIITAGVHRCPSIEVAEASKALENTQRDVNIALMNEFAQICFALGISTQDVLEAAGTKWNFHKYSPGLVGGHCIGVDPYYLAYQAQKHGVTPDLILDARKTNESVAPFIAQTIVKAMVKHGKTARSVLVLGATFKEDCPDLRNSKVQGIVSELVAYGCQAVVTDPVVDALEPYGANTARDGFPNPDTMRWEQCAATGPYWWDAILLAVPHAQFLAQEAQEFLTRHVAAGTLIFDVKGKLRGGPVEALAKRTKNLYWSL